LLIVVELLLEVNVQLTDWLLQSLFQCHQMHFN